MCCDRRFFWWIPTLTVQCPGMPSSRFRARKSRPEGRRCAGCPQRQPPRVAPRLLPTPRADGAVPGFRQVAEHARARGETAIGYLSQEGPLQLAPHALVRGRAAGQTGQDRLCGLGSPCAPMYGIYALERSPRLTPPHALAWDWKAEYNWSLILIILLEVPLLLLSSFSHGIDPSPHLLHSKNRPPQLLGRDCAAVTPPKNAAVCHTHARSRLSVLSHPPAPSRHRGCITERAAPHVLTDTKTLRTYSHQQPAR